MELVQALLTVTEFLHADTLSVCLSQIIFEKVLTKLSEQTECKNGTCSGIAYCNRIFAC